MTVRKSFTLEGDAGISAIENRDDLTCYVSARIVFRDKNGLPVWREEKNIAFFTPKSKRTARMVFLSAVSKMMEFFSID